MCKKCLQVAADQRSDLLALCEHGKYVYVHKLGLNRPQQQKEA